jgi:choline dehydrogenase-like flavoprotein
MFADAREIPTGTVIEADICIVGAGAAGITLARSFNGGSLRVLLLESGGLEYDPEVQDFNVGSSDGLPYFPLAAARLRYLGGTTNHWGGVCRPFQESDFLTCDWIPLSGWPIRKGDLDPYYGPAGINCGIRSWSAYEAYDNSPAPLLASGSEVVTRTLQRVDGVDRRFNKNYTKELRASKNITTLLYANARDIQADERARSAKTARVASLGGNTFSVVARAFVLAAGGIENARILLVSRDQQVSGLGNQHDVVGRFFLEHPRFVAGTILPHDPNLRLKYFEWHRRSRISVRSYLALSPKVQEREVLSESSCGWNQLTATRLQVSRTLEKCDHCKCS